MSVGGVGGAREVEVAQQKQAQGGSGFAATMKKADAAKEDAAKQDAAKSASKDDAQKADKKKDADGADDAKAAGKKKGDGKAEKKDGKAETGEAREAREAKGEPHGRVDRDGKGKKGEGEGEGKGKADVDLGAKAAKKGAELGERAGGELLKKTQKQGEFTQVLGQRAKDVEKVQKTNMDRDQKFAERIDKPGEVSSSKLNQKDDKKNMQDEIARNMFPGEVPHPFLLQQIEAPAAVEAARPVIAPEIVDKIVDKARFGMNAEGAHEFQIDLKQDVYAGSQLKIATKDGKVSVEVIADNPEVARSFEAKAQEIAKSLSDRGLNVTSVNVTLKDTSSAQQQAPRDGMGGAAGSKARQQAMDNQRGSGRDYSA